MLHVRTAQTQLENILRDSIAFALRRRLPPVASIAALRQLGTVGASGDSLRTVEDLVSVVPGGNAAILAFRWLDASTGTDDGVNYVRPADRPVSMPGRWQAWTSPLRFSQDVGADSYTLDALPLFDSQHMPLQAVIILDKRMEVDEMLELAAGQLPCVFITADGDDDADLTSQSGYRWANTYRFVITVIAQNLRDRNEATQGSSVAADPFPGANTIDGMIWELIAGTTLFDVEEGIVNVWPTKGDNYTVDEGQRMVLREREWSVSATVQKPQAPNETGPATEVAAQANLTQLGQTPDELDLANLVTSGCSLIIGPGLVKPIAAGTALIGGVLVTYAGELRTFPTSVDTYRDLNPNGTMTFTSVAYTAAPPPVPTGALRIAVTRTDGSGVVYDEAIAASSVPYGNRNETDLTS